MRGKLLFVAALFAATSLTVEAPAQQVELGNRPVLEAAGQLHAREYVWAPELAGAGPLLIIVNLETQRLIVFRNGVPIGASTVSTGKRGYETPTGVFSILQKEQVHYSKTYDNAPMPNMQRLTWKGIALHGGHLPGYPASHGCIRLPPKFASLLFGATNIGMTVVITRLPVGPQTSPSPDIAANSDGSSAQSLANAAYEWHPERVKHGIVSVVVSIADQRAVVLADGVRIGSAPVHYTGTINAPVAYVLKSRDSSGQQWLKLQYSGAGNGMSVPVDEGRKFDAPTAFRNLMATALSPGSVVIVTPQSIRAGALGSKLKVIESDEGAR